MRSQSIVAYTYETKMLFIRQKCNLNQHTWKFQWQCNMHAHTGHWQESTSESGISLLFIEIQFVYNLFSLIFDNLFWLPSMCAVFSPLLSVAAAATLESVYYLQRLSHRFYLLLHILTRIPSVSSSSPLLLLAFFLLFLVYLPATFGIWVSFQSHVYDVMLSVQLLSCNFGHWFPLSLDSLTSHSIRSFRFGLSVTVCVQNTTILPNTFFCVSILKPKWKRKKQNREARELQSIFICYLLIVWIQNMVSLFFHSMETEFSRLSLLFSYFFFWLFLFCVSPQKTKFEVSESLMIAAAYMEYS